MQKQTPCLVSFPLIPWVQRKGFTQRDPNPSPQGSSAGQRRLQEGLRPLTPLAQAAPSEDERLARI